MSSIAVQNTKTSSHEINAREHAATELVEIFDQVFSNGHKTRLIGGAEEPLYLPAKNTGDLHTIFFTRDYFASALHEVAHWCLAGESRRKQVDYGYWYLPDGRDSEQQQLFEKVEALPQALEWIFCNAAAFPFRLSVDNLNGSAGASTEFKQAVWLRTQKFCENGLPKRAQLFANALKKHFFGYDYLNKHNYRIESLS